MTLKSLDIQFYLIDYADNKVTMIMVILILGGKFQLNEIDNANLPRFIGIFFYGVTFNILFPRKSLCS